MMRQAQPVCKYILCIYQDILPWVINSVYTQEDKTQYWKLANCQHAQMAGKNYTRK